MNKFFTNNIIIKKASLWASFYVKGAFIFAFLLSLSACIPTITRVYLTPDVKGKMIDVTSLKSVPNAAISQRYENKRIVQTLTNNKGEFHLASYSEIQGKLLMAGHSLKNYQLVATVNDIDFYHTYRATRLMYQEESVEGEVVFVDTEPSVFAPPPRIEDKTTQKWHQDVQSPLFADCNVRLGKQVIDQLALARKTLTHQNKSLTSLAYVQVRFAWDDYFSSCKNGSILNPELLSDIRMMNNEISTYIDPDYNRGREH